MGIYAMPWAAASLGSGTRGASRMFDSDDDEDDRFGGGDDQRVFFPRAFQAIFVPALQYPLIMIGFGVLIPAGWATAMPRIQAENFRSDSFPGGR
jgi:hypothetical protein